jgi:inner membrane protein
MDPFTQGALGAALPQSLARPEVIKRAALLGCISGMAPDLDVLIQSSTDPLLFLEFHRQFTHALIFIPLGALICCLLLYPLVRRHLSFRLAYLFCLLGYGTHGLLDACTTYGTQLLWPFSDARIAWNNVSVVDPLVTLPLIMLVTIALVKKNPVFARIGMVWVCAYLLLGVLQRERAEAAGQALAESRGHDPVRLEAKPGFANLLVWKIVYETDARFYVDAVRVGLGTRVYPGDSISQLNVARDFPDLRENSRQRADIERFRWFSNDYLAVDQVDPDRIVDVRYSMVANEIEALWSIRINQQSQDQHVAYVTQRQTSEDMVARFMALLIGK